MKKLFAFVIVLIILAGGGWFVLHERGSIPSKTATQKMGSNGAQAASFDKKQHSLDDPASLWLIVNKRRPLQPKTYAPNDLVVPNIPLRLAASQEEMHVRKDTAGALEAMAAAAKADGAQLMLASGYRSYNFQVGLYNGYVKTQGQAAADSQSARPGYSEHQTGMAADLEPASRSCEVETCFANTTEGKWLAANAYKYGFIIRYPQNMQNVTGYIYEPWHVRYVGAALAAELHNEGSPTLEQFFSLAAAPDYGS